MCRDCVWLGVRVVAEVFFSYEVKNIVVIVEVVEGEAGVSDNLLELVLFMLAP